MDDTELGTRDHRGNWAPNEPVDYGPLFAWPPKPASLGRWLFGFPGYLWPMNLVYLLAAVAAWYWTIPSVDEMRDLSADWIGVILVRNLVLVLAWNALFHYPLYMRRTQQERFKYNAKWMGRDSGAFTFGTQMRDNVFWTLASAVPLVTAWEVVTWWMFAGNHIPWLDFGDNPIWFVGLFLLVPLIREVHFHLVHRLLHWPPLYRSVHGLHHRNVNPTGWSGLSMHPVEHLVYFSGVLVHWVIPSHPVHALFHLQHALLSPIPGHTGFDRFELGERRALAAGGYAHYLHHKYFEVNYSDGAVPLDRWFGSFHDGSPRAHETMKRRRAARSAGRASRDVEPQIDAPGPPRS